MIKNFDEPFLEKIRSTETIEWKSSFESIARQKLKIVIFNKRLTDFSYSDDYQSLNQFTTLSSHAAS